MGSRWYYRIDEVEHGPVTAQDLRDLASMGGIRTEDLVREDGGEGWHTARKVRGLFRPGNATTQSDDGEGAGGRDDEALAATPDGGATLSGRMQQAERTTVLMTERARLSSVSLATAFLALGRRIYDERAMEQTFADFFEQIDKLREESARAKESAKAGGSAHSIIARA